MNEAAIDPGFEFVQRLAVELAGDSFNLPPFPETALRVQDALKDPDVSIELLSSIVSFRANADSAITENG